MAANTNPIFPSYPKNWCATIESTDGTTPKDLVIAEENGARVESIAVTSTDTADRTLELYYHDGTASRKLGEVLIPDGSGTNGVDKPVSFLTVSNFPWLFDAIVLEANKKLQVAAKAAVTNGKKIEVVVIKGGIY